MSKPNVTIAELRMRENKMSQEKLASAIGVSTQTINAWEKDITVIRGENLIKLCRYFNVKSSDILGA
ncbi:helix-turn-helix transcriptional regulator [Streptococcus agalactiae]|uniref:helix-turn-helix transcriptional regulator n=1 Tax=Streptococcus agalactiae TaxID=1311 RepID=UPI00221F5033|nr:helix-turn-helix transcriptional regulator [Streptococcus agalactiae]MCW1398772.1 helix-turn-helix transcriptional regulator [Streptococcus agalactiae]HEN2499470.1 helix-turn-helix transcriptional regulator [Streptococcus agalactiae]HEN2534995.1 helix-turn-helix transcriptional regulator [Streptococcus agalactiae]